jgi:hypothetical protein
VVHHRDQSNCVKLLVTLCIRCHIRIHRSSSLRYWFSEMLMRLWRELHPSDPVQLQLTFGNSETREVSEVVRKGGESYGAALCGFATCLCTRTH